MLGFDISLTQSYRDLGRIGSGGFAQVHKVRSLLDNRIYALKMIQIRPRQCKQDIIQTIHKFLDQVKILSYLNHKNIIHYHGCWIQTQKQQQINEKLQRNSIQIDGVQSGQVEDDIVMVVMEDEFESNGIQFGQSDDHNSRSNGNNNNNNFNNNMSSNTNNNHHNNKLALAPTLQLTFDINQQQPTTNNTFIQTPTDHSVASENIRMSYKMIKIFVLTELGEGNLQQYLYRRNIERKNCNSSGVSNNNSINNKNRQLQQQKQQQQCYNNNTNSKKKHLGTISNNKNNKSKLPSHLNFQQQQQPLPITPSSITPNQLSHTQSPDELLTNYRMIIQIIEGLEYLHSKKIIHRDVKLHNIVIDAQKKCKIIDYGLAKKTRMLQSIDYHPKDFSCQNIGLMHLNIPQDERIDQIFSSSVGTRIYSSPQQITSQRYDHRTDIYSLAIVILMFFCDFTTNHQELTIIQKIRKLDIDFIQCDLQLKNVMIKCLSQQKSRPRLSEVKQTVRQLLRQRYQTRSRKQLPQKSLGQKQNVLQKQQSIYIMQNSKLKKKISKQDYMMLSNYVIVGQDGKKEKQQSTSSNSDEKNEDQKIKVNDDMLRNLNGDGV